MPLPLAPSAPKAFPDLADIETSFLKAGGDFLVAELNTHLVGMGGIRPTNHPREADAAQVLRVRVHPATRRQGVGRGLMAALEQRARDLGLHHMVLDTADNQPEAVAFYQGLGYHETAREHQPGSSWALVYVTKPLSPI